MTLARLEKLSGYFSASRRVGHTWTMLQVINSLPPDASAVVICANHGHATSLAFQTRSHPNVKFISMNQMDEKLLGQHAPILIDHFALQALIADASRERRAREAEIREASQDIRSALLKLGLSEI